MWFLFGRRVRVRRVPGGKVIRRRCPECGVDAKFHECQEKESYSVFFVPFTADTETTYCCGACGETFDLVDSDSDLDTDQRRELEGDLRADEPPRISADELRRQRLAEALAAKRERDVERARAVHSNETDRQLAALKKKLGR